MENTNERKHLPVYPDIKEQYDKAGSNDLKETIRNFNGQIMGTIEDQGGKKVARDFYGKILGTYDHGDGKTRDFYGRIVANGNTLAGLIAQADAGNKR